ncbi:RHS repeat-associated core domain-containing protein, partial [Streptomyces zhaozhouensis]
NDSYQLTAETNPLGHTTTHTWDRYDHTLTTTNPLGHTTRYEYDEHGNVTAVVRPDGREIRAEYNEFGQTTELVHADGSVWRQAYDTAGNRVALLDPAGRRTRYTFDDHGGLASVVDAAGNINRIHCDAAGLPRSLTNAMERATRYDRDAFGRLTRVTDPLGATSHTEYTTEGKPLRRSDPLNGVQTWAWDAEGNCLSHTDENGGTTHFEYGVFDQLKVQTDPDGARYEFIHDTELNVIRVANPQGHTWDYTYDAAGRLIAESDFDNRSVTYALDANGELLERTNALGQSVRFRHDVCGNLITKASASETSTFAYDPLGRLVRASNTHAEVVIERDPGGHIVSESINGLNVTYSRDRLGRMRTRTTPSGHTSTWDYNASGMPTSLKTADQNLVFSYDAADREIARALPSGISLNHTWDPSGRMANQVVTSENRVILRRAFTYRPDHYLTGVTDTTDSITRYSLDAVGRITAVTTPVATERYVYDAAGNQLVSPQGEHDYDGSRVAQAGATRFSYDGAGRTVLRVKTRISRKPDTWQYTWDEEDRLTAVRTPDGAIWRYRYDPLGRRIEKEQLNEQGERTARVSFAWSGTELVEQSGTHGCSDRETVLTWDYLGQRPVTQSETSTERESDKRFYAIVTDLIGTPTELVDTTGNVAWRSQNCVLGTDFQYARGEAANTPLRFPGQYADPESGWHYNFLRHYDPETARYTSPDPLGLGPAPNHYAYVHNPHTWTDPLGLAAHPARPRRQPEQVTETYADINQARNRALELLGDINPHTRQPYVGRLESAATHGQVVGFETVVDGTWKRFRMDYDPGKGPHFNVEIGRGAEGQR